MTQASDKIVVVGNQVPRMGNNVTSAIGRALVRLAGWKVQGELPNAKKLMVVVAPHTSNWDFVYCMFFVLALRLKLSFMMKKEAFFWPFKGLFMKLGGLPIDRKATGNTVDQVVDWYAKNASLWVAITPEGSRSKRERWKSGYARIAKAADVPILLVGFNYPDKTLYLENLGRVEEEPEAHTEALRLSVTARYTGRHKEKL